MNLFRKPADYAAFESLISEVHENAPVRILSYCLMPNHWHFVVWPERDGDLARFLQRLTLTHATRWQKHRRCAGYGHVYQGRFKSFPVQDDEHLLTVMRYVERNPLRAGLVARAEDWTWGSAFLRGESERPAVAVPAAEFAASTTMDQVAQ